MAMSTIQLCQYKLNIENILNTNKNVRLTNNGYLMYRVTHIAIRETGSYIRSLNCTINLPIKQ